MSDLPENIVIGSQKGRLAGGKFTRAKGYKRLPKQALYLGALIIIAALLAGGWAWHKQHQQSKKAAAEQEKAQLVNQASSKLAPQNSGSLQSIAEQLEKQPGYEKDPNALYVLTTYYLNIGDTARAQDYMTKLKAVYDPSKGFDASLKPVTGWMTIDQLQAKLNAQVHPKQTTKPAGFGG